MIIIQPAGATAPARSEQRFMRALESTPGILLANVNLPQTVAAGAFTREVDGVLITPTGVATVEVKGVRAIGELHTPRMDSWYVADGDERTVLHGRPHAQALAHSKFLASFLKDASVPVGWICAVLAFAGDRLTLPGGGEVAVVDNVHLVRVTDTVGEVIQATLVDHPNQREVPLEIALAILTALECVEQAPSAEALEAEGFRRQETIAADMDERRQAARAQFLAHSDTIEPAGAHAQRTCNDIADQPIDLTWKVTPDRLAASQALDLELTETGAFVDGVPIHRRLVAYAARKDLDLADVVATVSNPVEILGDESDQLLTYCGETHAVSVRGVDGMAIYYKPVDEARAERHGATVDGVEISARAARQAVTQCSMSLEALARIVTCSEERWWMPGTTDVAHARGEFVAVTGGVLGPVLYVLPRAIATAKATSKAPVAGGSLDSSPNGPRAPRASEAVVGEVTVKVAAVGWGQRRGLSAEVLAEAATNFTGRWEGQTVDVEVRAGQECAVVYNTRTMTVLSAMSLAEAADYRDGITKDGVHLTGRCVMLLRRRKVSADDAVAAVLSPLVIARSEHSDTTVYIGDSLAVTVENETGSVADFTFTDHARTMIRRKELVRIGGSEAEAGAAEKPPGRPSPAMLARMASRVVLVEGGPQPQPVLTTQ